MKLGLDEAKTQRLAFFTSAEHKQKVQEQKHTFSNNFLKQQMFLQPRSEHGERGELNQESQKMRNQRVTGMRSSLVSNDRVQKKEHAYFKKMIADLSHQLLVKDSMIDSLRCELMATQSNDLEDSDYASEQSLETPKENTKKKSNYHFKSLIEKNAVSYFSLKNNGGKGNKQQPSSLEQKATLSESQFIKIGQTRILNNQYVSPKAQSSIKSLNESKVFNQLEEALRIKQKQLQAFLFEKKVFTKKIVESQKIMLAQEDEIKSLRSLRRVNSKQGLKEIDNKKIQDYEQKIFRLISQNNELSKEIEQIKNSQSEQIQSSIKQWKKMNLTMTDSVVKLNQENSTLTKKINDLETRLTASFTKSAQLQKQNNTLKYNLQNQKNSYNTLSLHHKHQKDQYGHKIILLQRQIERVRSKNEQSKLEEQKAQLLKQKQQIIIKHEQTLKNTQTKHSTEMTKLKQYSLQQSEQMQKIKIIYQQLQTVNTSLKSNQTEIQKEVEKRETIQNKLNSALKTIDQYESHWNQQHTQIQHYKSQLTKLINKQSELKKQIIEQIHAKKELKKELQCGRENQTGERIGELEEVIQVLENRIRDQRQEIIVLRNSSKQSNLEQIDQNSHNKYLNEIQQRDRVIKQLKQSLRHQQDNTISVKIHLDEVNRKLFTHLQILETTNKNLISSQLKFGNYFYQSQQKMNQLKEDNQGLQRQLKVIYEKLQCFEQRLESGSDENVEEQIEYEYKKRNDEIVSSN